MQIYSEMTLLSAVIWQVKFLQSDLKTFIAMCVSSLDFLFILQLLVYYERLHKATFCFTLAPEGPSSWMFL
jgi:hypothetical protein